MRRGRAAGLCARRPVRHGLQRSAKPGGAAPRHRILELEEKRTLVLILNKHYHVQCTGTETNDNRKTQVHNWGFRVIKGKN